MKKKLFFLLAFMCSVSIFMSCSKDDGDTWKEIPKNITAENATLTLNGKSIAGTAVTIDVQSAKTAIVTLKNVLYGHSSVPVNVVMEEQDNHSYNFQGSTNIKGETKTDTDLGLTVKVNGNITKDGKMMLDITTSGWGAIAGSYANDSLSIKINNVVQDAKFPVTVLAVSESKATLKFQTLAYLANDFSVDVELLPVGEMYRLSGSSKKEGSYDITINGSIKNSVLEINVDYKSLSPVVGKWGIKIDSDDNPEFIFEFKTKEGYITLPQEFIDMLPDIIKEFIKKQMSDEEVNMIFKMALGILSPCFESVEFKDDGNVIVTYHPITDPDQTKTLEIFTFGFKDKEMNLVVDLKSVIGMDLKYPVTLHYYVETDGSLKVWVDKAILNEYLVLATKVLPLLKDILGDKYALVEMILNVVNNNIVGASTQFDLGLVLEKR